MVFLIQVLYWGMALEPDNEDKRDVKARVIRIISHQTGGPQPATADLRLIKITASHANYNPTHIEWAVNTLVDQGSISYNDEGYQLESAKINRGQVSF